MAEIITILSGKGGTGKTLFAVNIGVFLALRGKRVLIMDGNFQARGVDLALGMEGRVVYDMVDVLNGDCRIRQALTRNKKYENLYILEPPIVKKGGGISLLEFSVLMDRVREDFEYVILDSSSASTAVSEGLGLRGDKVLMVTTQDPISVRAGQSLAGTLKARGVKEISLVVNQVKIKLTDKGYLTDVEEIAEGFGVDVCGVIPYDDSMHVAFNNGQATVGMEDSAAAEHLTRVIQRFLLTE